MGKVSTGIGYLTGRKLIVNTTIKHTPEGELPKIRIHSKIRKGHD